MDYAHFHTSGLVRRYIDEPGRPEVLRLLRENQCVVSAVLPVEVRSARRGCVGEKTLDTRRVPSPPRLTGPQSTLTIEGSCCVVVARSWRCWSSSVDFRPRRTRMPITTSRRSATSTTRTGPPSSTLTRRPIRNTTRTTPRRCRQARKTRTTTRSRRSRLSSLNSRLRRMLLRLSSSCLVSVTFNRRARGSRRTGRNRRHMGHQSVARSVCAPRLHSRPEFA